YRGAVGDKGFAGASAGMMFCRGGRNGDGGHLINAVASSGGLKCIAYDGGRRIGDAVKDKAVAAADAGIMFCRGGCNGDGGHLINAVASSGGLKCIAYNGGRRIGDAVEDKAVAAADAGIMFHGAAGCNGDGGHLINAVTSSGGLKCIAYDGGRRIGDAVKDKAVTAADAGIMFC